MRMFQLAVVEGSLSLLQQCSIYVDLAHFADTGEKGKTALFLDLLTQWPNPTRL